MTTPTRVLFAGVAVLSVMGAFAFFGLTPFMKSIVISGSSTGATFNTAKVAMVNMAPSTSAASSTSLLNSDGSGRWIEGVVGACTGTGSESVKQAALGFKAATTSVANLGLQGSTNYAANVTIATSTTFSNVSSTTANSNVLAYWPTGTYLTFLFTATTSAACTVGVEYVQS